MRIEGRRWKTETKRNHSKDIWPESKMNFMAGDDDDEELSSWC